ncbi:hypothetical protein CEXT_72961 [Caerostris extrusa]|uniref:Uncharacterized protein n=1 Tax=Caerostris extrusa TaxID=172846 RepID=A0AAV4P1F4_CAEEX|nr:hypothetical protein CEXT_72961 [Caerostris extrusa]
MKTSEILKRGIQEESSRIQEDDSFCQSPKISGIHLQPDYVKLLLENFKILACKKNRATSLHPVIREDGRATSSIQETHEAILSIHFPSVTRNEHLATPIADMNKILPHHISRDRGHSKSNQA